MPFFNLSEIVKKLPVIDSNKLFIIAIDGGSGSGKTLLAEEWKRFKPSVRVIGLDEFHIPVDDSFLDKRSPVENFETAFDIGYVTKKVLKPLHESRTAVFEVQNPQSGNYGRKWSIKPKGIIILEGVYSHRPVWSEYIDFKIWLELSGPKRLKRMKVRQANSGSQMKCWQRTEKWYMKKYKPRESADLVIRDTE